MLSKGNARDYLKENRNWMEFEGFEKERRGREL